MFLSLHTTFIWLNGTGNNYHVYYATAVPVETHFGLLQNFHQEGRSGNFSELFVILSKIFPKISWIVCYLSIKFLFPVG